MSNKNKNQGFPVTKQGVRDLNGKQTNARKAKKEETCMHEWIHDPYCPACSLRYRGPAIDCVERCKMCKTQRLF